MNHFRDIFEVVSTSKKYWRIDEGPTGRFALENSNVPLTFVQRVAAFSQIKWRQIETNSIKSNVPFFQRFG